MRADEVNVTDEHWSIARPTYYVTFWTESEPSQWSSRAFRVTDAADVNEVIAWAERFPATDYQLAVESPDDRNGWVHLKGVDPLA